jgi:hypothetical protein
MLILNFESSAGEKMKSTRFLKISPLVIFLIFVFYSTPHPSSSVLVKIQKNQNLSVLPFSASDIKVIQELKSVWIAEMRAELLPKFLRARIQCEVLDSEPEGKPYYLVNLTHEEQISTFRKLGNVRKIEDRVCLFWCEKEDVREILPPEVQIKRLPPRTSLTLKSEPARSLGQKKFAGSRAPDPAILQMISQVSKTNLTSYIQSLQDFKTRYASTPNCEASGTFLNNFFNKVGVQSEYDPFFFPSNYSSRNVAAIIPGKVAPNYVVIVGAHYDSYSKQPFTLAPGADDNASGTAAVMEIGRILSRYPFNFTVKLICFSAEEWGLYGSQHYASHARQSGEKIIAVINMDMVAYTDRIPEDLDIIVNSDSEWLADKYISSTQTYTPMDLLKIINPSYVYSDHSSFWDEKYSALCGIEDENPSNPNYHKITDTLDTLNMDFAASVTKASLAVAADLAEPVSTPRPPTELTSRSQVSSSLFSSIKTAYLSWHPSQDEVQGYNIYRTTISHASYQKLNSALLSQASHVDRFLNPDTVYYYVVTSVDGQGRESNNSEEVRDNENNK